MRLPDPIRDNLRFLLAESGSQVANLQAVLESPLEDAAAAALNVLDRRSYAYNLKMRIHDGCLNEVRRRKGKPGLELNSLRAAEGIASELERITDLSYECVCQISGQKHREAFRPLASVDLVSRVSRGIQLVRDGLDEEGSRTALRVGETARKVFEVHEKFFEEYSGSLQKMKRPQRGVRALIVAHRLNEMGTALQEISEAMISANLGQPMPIERFRSLESAFEELGLDGKDGEVETIAETRSGSGISGIGSGDQDGYLAIMKDGKKRKMKEELESVESWHEIFPGLAPQIIAYHKQGSNASLLIEHLPGFTFEQLVLNRDNDSLAKTLKHLTKTLKAVWNETRKPGAEARARHMAQLRKRLSSVQEVHPWIGEESRTICGARVPGLSELIDAAEEVEEWVAAPFAVYIHGDFNLDNIIFDPNEKRINFVDLHRSRFSDYTQDVSVFMVSNYRLQALDLETRRRIRFAAVSLYQFASEYAAKNGDDSFELRLGLGLARSFITSTRFILDRSLARAMYLRGYYILERIRELDKKKKVGNFRLAVAELF